MFEHLHTKKYLFEDIQFKQNARHERNPHAFHAFHSFLLFGENSFNKKPNILEIFNRYPRQYVDYHLDQMDQDPIPYSIYHP
jgi:hypothetical protein